MLHLLDEILRRVTVGETVALCVVVATRGSTPQGAGAKMLCLLDGSIVGTLGGGCVEAEVRQRALELAAAGRSQLLKFHLDSDYGWDDGLICGGAMDVLVQVIGPGCDLTPFRGLVDALRAGESARLILPYARDGKDCQYLEELSPPPVLVIAGAGHVGQSLATLMAASGFDVDVIDDRADYASRQRFPQARRLFVGAPEGVLRDYPITGNTYVVIVTRGHRNDGRALEAVVRSSARYIGLIGSRSKIKLIYADLVARGYSIDELLRVHAPIGLDVGAVTVPEIAVSIAAELVAVRRYGASGGRPMKMDESQLRAWLASRVATR
jgi:xanthine dehydrogenase accessory factor